MHVVLHKHSMDTGLQQNTQKKQQIFFFPFSLRATPWGAVARRPPQVQDMRLGVYL